MSAASPASPPWRCGLRQNPMTGTTMMCCACHMATTASLWPQQALVATGFKVMLGCKALLTGTFSHTSPGALELLGSATPALAVVVRKVFWDCIALASAAWA